MSTILHYRSSFSFDGFNVDLPLACPRERSCTVVPGDMSKPIQHSSFEGRK
ncbi:hypothetical protein DPMN_014841 [Dreissena polymorpha]|uniref:Uncharacterized protein n=1 Tax=Dreissena polymorpha TaxID=45954 RepID=A0A9D4NA57_DREPO|nr:hypothetical protein DPMN_014841 [Dreissena polymorpha]